eukprot:373181-Pyramimonas_sp.AAC.1
MGELYGEYHVLTNEWTDGLASTLIRQAIAHQTPDQHWVVFDGAQRIKRMLKWANCMLKWVNCMLKW